MTDENKFGVIVGLILIGIWGWVLFGVYKSISSRSITSEPVRVKSITAISGSQGRLVVEGDELRVVQKIQIKYI